MNCPDCAGSAECGVTGDPDRTSGARGAAQLGGRFESSRWRPRNTLGVRAGEASIELFLVFCWVFVGNRMGVVGREYFAEEHSGAVFAGN